MMQLFVDAKRLLSGEPRAQYAPVYFAQYLGKVVSKERPRSSKTGHMYTPEKTRAFEKAITAWAEENMEGRPVFYPLAVEVHIYDYTVDPVLLGGVTSKQHGDIDNKVKAVLDACNGIIWRDDKQINELLITRTYKELEGFDMLVRRNGLSKNELEQFRKHLRGSND